MRLNSSYNFVFLTIAVVLLVFSISDYSNWNSRDFLIGGILGVLLLLIALVSTFSTYIAITEDLKLQNSGYYTFGKVVVDILRIKYIYRFPHMHKRGYGSRMVIYFLDSHDKLISTAIRELNHSNENIIELLKRLREINPNIELDPEYMDILAGKRVKEEPSENTVATIEARLKSRGEVI